MLPACMPTIHCIKHTAFGIGSAHICSVARSTALHQAKDQIAARPSIRKCCHPSIMRVRCLPLGQGSEMGQLGQGREMLVLTLISLLLFHSQSLHVQGQWCSWLCFCMYRSQLWYVGSATESMWVCGWKPDYKFYVSCSHSTEGTCNICYSCLNTCRCIPPAHRFAQCCLSVDLCWL